MKIAVEKRHIDKGLPQTCDSCPIALAVREKLGRYAYVDCGEVHVYPTSERPYDLTMYEAVYELPEKAIDFYKMFDDHEDVEPLEFSMNLVNQPEAPIPF